MQTLGLSDSTPRTESRWRALLWPTIGNEGDFDYVTTQGFWVCFVVAAVTLGASPFTGVLGWGVFEGAFFFLAGVGVRQRSRVAAIAAFSAYFLGALVAQRYTGNGFGIVRIVFLALLFANIRGNWLSARWAMDRQSSAPLVRLNQTIGDKLSDQLPMFLWPKVRIAFYVLAALEIGLLLWSLSGARQRSTPASNRLPRAAASGSGDSLQGGDARPTTPAILIKAPWMLPYNPNRLRS
ncbi:MAG TPA: hypothetical protein VN924_22990 [Bryobacteraceae bacterium]|nr:hypothetical protein [Bryobacteraceae bacterium]